MYTYINVLNLASFRGLIGCRGRGQTHEAEAKAEADNHEAEAEEAKTHEAEARFFGLEAEAKPRGLTSLLVSQNSRSSAL